MRLSNIKQDISNIKSKQSYRDLVFLRTAQHIGDVVAEGNAGEIQDLQNHTLHSIPFPVV